MQRRVDWLVTCIFREKRRLEEASPSENIRYISYCTHSHTEVSNVCRTCSTTGTPCQLWSYRTGSFTYNGMSRFLGHGAFGSAGMRPNKLAVTAWSNVAIPWDKPRINQVCDWLIPHKAFLILILVECQRIVNLNSQPWYTNAFTV